MGVEVGRGYGKLCCRLHRPGSAPCRGRSRCLRDLGPTWLLPRYKLTEFDERYSDRSVQSRIDQRNERPHYTVLSSGSIRYIQVDQSQERRRTKEVEDLLHRRITIGMAGG